MSDWKFTARQLVKNPISLMGAVLIGIFIVIAIFAPLIAPTPAYHRGDPYMMPRDSYYSTPEPPSAEHIFGTTMGQYDIFYGVIWGTRSAFRVALVVMAITICIGILLGSLAGYFGGVIDEVIMRITDIFLAFPWLILAMALTAAMGQGLKSVMIALIVVWWPSYARLIRGDILQLREEDYIEASRGLGASSARVILRHVLPNAIYPCLIMASLDIGAVVLSAAALSFLGLGAPEGYADWGQMTQFAQGYITGVAGDPFKYWYAVVIPGLFILLFVLGWNLLGDAFRDIFDPRLARR